MFHKQIHIFGWKKNPVIGNKSFYLTVLHQKNEEKETQKEKKKGREKEKDDSSLLSPYLQEWALISPREMAALEATGH